MSMSMNLPSLDDLIPEQWSVYDQPPDASLVVAGPPGSGKTSLAVHRTRYLASPELRRNVLVVTRNRMLAAFARGLGGGVFDTRTMSTFISRHYSDRFGRYIPQLRPFVYKWDEVLEDYAQAAAEPVFDHLVIDEGQNLPAGFFQWASRYGARALTVFADEHQATDGEGQRSSLAEICDATGCTTVVALTTNHRNTPEIAAVAEHFHDSRIVPPAMVRRAAGGEKPELLRLGSLDELARRVAVRYRNRGESIGVIVHLKEEARRLHQAIARHLRGERVDVYTSDSASGAEEEVRLREPGVTVLTGEAVIGLEFDAVYLLDLRRSLPCQGAADRRRMYMLCARARDALMLVDLPPYLTGEQLAALPTPLLRVH